MSLPQFSSQSPLVLKLFAFPPQHPQLNGRQEPNLVSKYHRGQIPSQFPAAGGKWHGFPTGPTDKRRRICKCLRVVTMNLNFRIPPSSLSLSSSFYLFISLFSVAYNATIPYSILPGEGGPYPYLALAQTYKYIYIHCNSHMYLLFLNHRMKILLSVN